MPVEDEDAGEEVTRDRVQRGDLNKKRFIEVALSHRCLQLPRIYSHLCCSTVAEAFFCSAAIKVSKAPTVAFSLIVVS